MNNYAIVGKGFIFPRHVQAIERTGGKVLLTCDIDPTKGADYIHWPLMFLDPKFKDVDTVVILTPNYLHSKIAFAARAHGKKVICEKPLCIDVTESTILDVMPILQLRYHPAIIKAKEKGVASANFTVTMFRDRSYFAGWKGNVHQSGGLLFNLGIHYLDILTYLLGPYVSIEKARSDIVAYDDLWDEWFEGEVTHKNGTSSFFIELCQQEKPREGAGASRKMTVTYKDGTTEDLELSQKENLSYEDLHYKCYEDFIAGTGLKASDATESLRLANDLYKSNQGR